MSKEEVISSLFQPTFGNRPLQYITSVRDKKVA